jgi:Hemerythrin HHE cation binding domain
MNLWFFGSKKEKVVAPPVSAGLQLRVNGDATPRPLQFDANLTSQLIDDHKHLLGSYGEMLRYAQLGRWNDAHATLQKFRVLLNAHLLLEGIKLYSYMSSRLQNDDDTATVFQAYKREMGAIGKVIFQFFDQYKDIKSLSAPTDKVNFLATAHELGAALTDRITREETHLYPLYQVV